MGKYEEAFSKNKEGVNEMNIILDNGAFMPEFAHKTDAGADLRSPIETVVPARNSVVIDTGVHVEIPEGYTGVPEIEIRIERQT